jgi:ribosomal protein S18 acetylase RimI-like enzyme
LIGQIREILPEEHVALGRLMVDVYSNLEGFPSPEDQPAYYELLADIGRFTQVPDAKVLVALSHTDDLLGGLVYFGDMAHYGSGGTATQEKNASGIRLLGVDPAARGQGVGSALTEACIEMATASGGTQIVLHTTQAMQVAWKMYEKLGFQRSKDLDFLQEGFPVFGFRLKLATGEP